MFKHAIVIPQFNYMYFCGIIYHPMAYKAIIAGATGLIGSKLLDILLNEPAYDEVLIFVRKDTGMQHKKLVQVIVAFDKLTDYNEMINGHAIFCCLGSTKKKTPDLTVYRKIDHDYPLQLAQLGMKNGIKQYHLVSALGADAASSNFYTKMKGETERDIKQLGLPCLHIYQPSLLTGDRKEYRLAEKIITPIAKLLNPLLFGSWKKYRSIAGATVAMAMFKQSINNEDGVFIHPSDNIQQIA
jgi:uncharacterized protein YbjT (DUF2867 family)